MLSAASSSPNMDHAARRLDEPGFTNVMAGFLLPDHRVNVFRQGGIVRALVHAACEVMVEEGKQAGAYLAVRGETHARTVPAEGMRHRRNDSNLAEAIVKRVAPRGLAGRVGKLAHRTELVQLLQDFIHGDNDFLRPYAVFFQRHKLNEPDHDAFFARKAGKLHDLVFIESAQ